MASDIVLKLYHGHGRMHPSNSLIEAVETTLGDAYFQLSQEVPLNLDCPSVQLQQKASMSI